MTLDKLIASVGTAGFALAAAASIAAAGCSGSAYGGGATYGIGNPNPSPSPSLAPGSQIFGVNLTGELATTDPTYGVVLGYFNSTGTVDMSSQVVHLTTAMPVVFRSFDGSQAHTASFLGNASANGASFPPQFNGSGSASPANTVISTANFSSGNLNPGTTSLQYDAGPPGFYLFGCAYHYNTVGMRTVVIVQ